MISQPHVPAPQWHTGAKAQTQPLNLPRIAPGALPREDGTDQPQARSLEPNSPKANRPGLPMLCCGMTLRIVLFLKKLEEYDKPSRRIFRRIRKPYPIHNSKKKTLLKGIEISYKFCSQQRAS